MNNSKRMIVTLVTGLLAVGVTVLLFFAAVKQRETVDWLGLMFLVLAELIATGGFLALDSRPAATGVFLRSGVYTTLTLYLVAAAVTSALFWLKVGRAVLWLCTFQAIFVAAVIILVMSLVTSAQAVENANRQTMANTGYLRQLADTVLLLMQEPANSAYQAGLEKVYESIHYSDLTAATSHDALIGRKIGELQHMLTSDEVENKEQAVQGLLDELAMLGDKRTIEAKAYKRGSI